jgi:hypothetical protein
VDIRLNLGNLKTPADILRLTSIISEMADQLDVLYTTSSPNGSISARQGRIALYKNGSSYELWSNTDGGTTWQRMDYGASTVGANKALSNLESVAINLSLISDTDNTDDLGSSAKQWKDLYINGLAYIDQLGENLDCNDKQLTNLIIENRTDDTGMTVTGQIWFRTDI